MIQQFKQIIFWGMTAALLFACSNDQEPVTTAPAATTAQSQPGTEDPAAVTDERPNILLIVLDDVGYTDLGAFGGEIETQNLDALATGGLLLTNFHSGATCSPTRSMLMSGTDNHIAGLGTMAEELKDNQKGNPGYEGYLNERVAALPDLLLDAGYHTYMTGKWHLGMTEETSPAGRGFEKSFALLPGGGGHFDDLGLSGPPHHKAPYRQNGKSVQLPTDFYTTRDFTTRMIDYLEADKADDKPFFAYLSYSAPHWPLQAPDASIAKYAGRYDDGYEALFERRIAALKERGLIAADVESWPGLEGEKSWAELTEEEKKYQSRLMEIYAAMIDDIDVYLGQLLAYLRERGELENTFIFVMSDNGAEGHDLSLQPEFGDWIKTCCDNSYENMGKANSYLYYGANWARAGVGPFRMFKGYNSEGGIRVPAFVNYPRLVAAGDSHDKFISVMDVMPTLLELTGVQHPGANYKGREVVAMKGTSMLGVLSGEQDAVHPADYAMGWELFGKRAMRKGDWKVNYVPQPLGAGEWQLFNLAEDPAEAHNVAASAPAKLNELITLWDEYAAANNVVLPTEYSLY